MEVGAWGGSRLGTGSGMREAAQPYGIRSGGKVGVEKPLMPLFFPGGKRGRGGRWQTPPWTC